MMTVGNHGTETQIVEIKDQFEYLSGTKCIAKIVISTKNGSTVRYLRKTRAGGYYMTD